MAMSSLSLPIDIPWERWCVSGDMIDRAACDSDRPAKWQSSIAVFKYVPAQEYQLHPGRKITYVKVVCTIAGYQPKQDEIQGVIKNLGGITLTPYAQAELERRLATYTPCNEAIVQVTVAPPAGSNVPLDKYPYFMEFQPKKRELIEVATDTNEVMSRSLESLNIKKSAGTAQSQEVLDIDQGFSAAGSGQGSGPAGGGGGSFSYSQQGQWGTKQLASAESGLARTTDASHERRETLSHTTQLTQLRHLLDSYHLGTNRAVFFIQPRPHTIQEPSGFVRGPRLVEGIQEFFLVVNQPEGQEDFCLDVRLDTGHLSERKIMTYAYKTDTVPLTFDNPTPVKEDTDVTPDGQTNGATFHDAIDVSPPTGGTLTLWSFDATLKYNCVRRTRSASTTYQSPDADYVIDVAAVGGQPGNVQGFKVLPNSQVIGDTSYTVTSTPDGEVLTIDISGTSRACFKGPISDLSISTYIHPLVGVLAFLDPTGFSASIAIGGAQTLTTLEAAKTGVFYASAPAAINQRPASANVEVEVFLRSRVPTIDTGKVERIFFITTRAVCCCAKQGGRHDDNRGDKSEEGIVYESVDAFAQPLNMTIADSEEMRVAMRNEMLASLASPRRTVPRPYAETRIWWDAVAPTLFQNPVARSAMREPAAPAVPKELHGRIAEPFREGTKRLTRFDVLAMPDAALEYATGLDASAARALRTSMLSTPPEKKAPPAPPAAEQRSKNGGRGP